MQEVTLTPGSLGQVVYLRKSGCLCRADIFLLNIKSIKICPLLYKENRFLNLQNRNFPEITSILEYFDCWQCVEIIIENRVKFLFESDSHKEIYKDFKYCIT